MKLQFEKVPLHNSSFLFKEEYFNYFDIPWHNHPEFELAVILEGEGKKFIGNSISNIECGDVIFTGPWLPHLWKSSDKSSDKKASHQIIIQFLPDFLGEDLFNRHEFMAIGKLFQKAVSGMLIIGKTRETIVQRMIEMTHQTDFERVINLLEILHILSQSSDLVTQSTPGFYYGHNEADASRMAIVYNYLLENYQQEIYLENIAQMVHLTAPAFSRYFKMKTKKTFSHVLNEIRIGQACQLLLLNNFSVSHIADHCGYYNLSNFNRAFKIIVKMTPSEYLKIHSL